LRIFDLPTSKVTRRRRKFHLPSSIGNVPLKSFSPDANKYCHADNNSVNSKRNCL